MKGKLMKLLRYLLFVIVLLAPSSAWAAFVVTPITTASQNSGGSGVVTTSSFNVSANSWVYVATLEADFIGSVQDSLGNNYARSVLAPVSSSYAGGFLFYYSTAQTGITVTYTASGSNGAGISLISIAGGNGTEDAGVPNGVSGSSAAPSVTGSNAPTLSGELFIGFVGVDDIFGGTTFTQAAGWSNAFTEVSFVGPGGNSWFLTGGYLVNAGSSNVTYAPSLSQAAVWGAAIDAVEPSGSPALTNHFLPLMGVGQ